MTVTVVYGKSTDGYLTSTSANYTTARNGSGVVVTGGTAIFVGQNFAGGTYQQHQGFIGFDFAAVPSGQVMTALTVRLQVASVLTPATPRNLELRSYGWSAGGLVAGDWRTAANIGVDALRATVQGVNSANGKYVYAASDELLANSAPGIATLEFVVVTDRQRAGTTPTLDEAVSIWSADVSGTTSDPALIFTTAPRSTLFGNLGAQGRLSDGTSVALEGMGLVAPNLQLIWRNHPGTASTTLGDPVPIGTGSAAFAEPKGLQAFTIAVGPDDSIYLIGRAGDAENSIRIATWISGGVGSNSWAYAGQQTVAMVAHDAAINQVAACVVVSNGLESLVVLAAHTAGTGWQNGHSGDVSYALLNTTALRAGGGSLVRGVGSAMDALFPSATAPADFSGYVNPVGTGLDLVVDAGNPGWFYATSFRRDQDMGSNAALVLSRGVLSATHAGLTVASPQDGLSYAVKDASAKLRAVACSPGVCALVTADADSGFGLSIDVRQHFGTDPGSVGLGSAYLAGETIPSMPDGPDVAGSHAWDVLYNATDNALWIYYVDVADPTQLMRTRFSLATYEATREEIVVLVLAGPITGVRVARNGEGGDLTRVYVSYTDAGVLELVSETDSFNVPPTAPALNVRDGFDATGPADLSWVFNDPNVGDSQSARRVWIEDQGTGTLALDTGKVASGATTYTVAGGTLVNAETYRWRVQTWDGEDLESPWSEWGVFQTAAGGSVTVTLPATDNVSGIVSDDVEVRWAATGTVQAAYRVWLYRTSTGALVSDSGWVTSADTARVVTGMLSDVEYRVEVQVRNGVGVVSNVGTRLITPSYGTPEPPVVTVVPVPDQGYTLVQVQNPLPGESGTGFPTWDFEDAPDVGTWGRERCAVEVSPEQAHAGTYSMKLTADGTGNALVRAPSLVLVPGTRYTARAWMYRPTGGQVMISVDWLDAGGGWVGSAQFETVAPAGVWVEVLVSATPPASAGRASIGPTLTGPPGVGAVVYTDDLILTAASDRPDVAFNLVMRRLAGTSDPWEILGQCQPDGEFRDYTAAGRVPYEYKARGVTA